MANNNIVSPGIYINETDQSFIPQGIIGAGAAIVGATAKGPVEVPTLVTSYNDYIAKFGGTITSGSNNGTYSFFNSTAAHSYFNNGGDSLLVSRVVKGTYTAASAEVSGSTGLGAAGTSFKLNTISAGADQNSQASISPANAAGLLSSGSKDNLRYEITQLNTGSGTFTLVIRRGDDDDNAKIILEQYNNLTLDPFDSNFIGKSIGTMYSTIANTGTTSATVQTNGDYPNVSKYIYASDILETPNYSDSSGNVRVAAYTASLPMNTTGGTSSKGFLSGTGAIAADAKFGKDITPSSVQGTTASDYTQSFWLLNDPAYTYTSIAAPGLNYKDDSTELDILLSNTKTRADALAVIDLADYADESVTEAVSQASSINNSYSAAYFPWLLSSDPLTGRMKWAPPSTFIPGVYAYNDKVGEPWFAPAGLNRGALPTVVKTSTSLPKSSRDTLYEAKVNPITSFPNAGVVVFGQKTLQNKASALDRINVRRLLITIKQFLDRQAGNIVFEQNTVATRNNFLAIVNPYLESVQQRQGLYAFKVVMDETINTAAVIDRNELVGEVYLQPTKTAEFIILNFNVQPTGATFPE
jgi:uncharacterized protein